MHFHLLIFTSTKTFHRATHGAITVNAAQLRCMHSSPRLIGADTYLKILLFECSAPLKYAFVPCITWFSKEKRPEQARLMSSLHGANKKTAATRTGLDVQGVLRNDSYAPDEFLRQSRVHLLSIATRETSRTIAWSRSTPHYHSYSARRQVMVSSCFPK